MRRNRTQADEVTLEALAQAANDPHRRFLITGGTVVSMDPEVGNLVLGDVLVEGNRILAVGPDLSDAANDGQTIVVSATNMIVMPGMHDTHRHCWQNQLRRLISGCDLRGYEAVTHRRIAPHYRPEDIYAGNFISALGAIDGGVTCVLDVSHNSRSAEHSNAAIEAFQSVGIRAIHASAPALSGEWDRQWPQDMARLKERYFSTSDGLLTLRSGVFGSAEIAGVDFALTPETLAFARDLGISLSVDAVFGPSASANIVELGRAGLLGPDITLIHCNDLTNEAWQMIADAGVSVSLCPTSDTQIGIFDALPPIQKVLDFGIDAGLSVDVECVLSSDMFTQMQSIYTTQRMLAFNRSYNGDEQAPAVLSLQAVLEMATIHGARTNGLLHQVGTLTPGKEADIILLGAEDINTMPLNNAIATIVLGADTRNVDTVWVAGTVKKWRGDLLAQDVTEIRRVVHASRDYLLAASGYSLDIFADHSPIA